MSSGSAVKASIVLGACLALLGCVTPAQQRRAGVLDYLYPAGKPATAASDVHLTLPLRVGLAFAPETGTSQVLTESRKQDMLKRIIAAFEGVEGVERIEAIPSSYLVPAGGFENVDQLRGMLGIDLLAMVSYDQTQFGDFGKSSLAYWTIVGGYFVEGNKNETHTFVDTSVFDIASRALLFNASGRSTIEGRSTAIEASEELRDDARAGFQRAVDDMIVQLQGALAAFREQARNGTVRGAGTPALEITGGGEAAGAGAGACGGLELALGLAVSLSALARRKQPRA